MANEQPNNRNARQRRLFWHALGMIEFGKVEGATLPTTIKGEPFSKNQFVRTAGQRTAAAADSAAGKVNFPEVGSGGYSDFTVTLRIRLLTQNQASAGLLFVLGAPALNVLVPK